MSRHSDDQDEAPPIVPPVVPYPLDISLETAYAPEPDDPQPQRPGAPTSDAWLEDELSRAPDAEQAAATGSGNSGADAPATGSGNDAEHGNRQRATGDALVMGAAHLSPSSPGRSRAQRAAADTVAVDTAPVTVAERAAQLPQQWMREYIAALYEVGGVRSLARRKVGLRGSSVSEWSVTRAITACPLFGEMVTEAIDAATDLVEAACIRGATIGDVQPIYQQGMHVGNKRVRNTKDAEIALKLRGRLDDGGQATGSGARPIKVDVVHTVDLPDVVREVAARLFGARQRLLDAETGRPAV